MALSKEDLEQQKIQLSVHGILYHVEDDHDEMVFLQSVREETMEGEHDILETVRLECIALCNASNEHYSGAVCVMTSEDTCDLVRSTSKLNLEHWEKAGLLRPMPLL